MDESRIDAHMDARVLISRGLRVPIVARITALSPGVVRKMYREITGKISKPGPTPAIMPLVETNAARAATSLYLSLYEQYAPDSVETMQIDWRAVLMAYDNFIRIVPTRFQLLNINEAWRASIGYRSGDLWLTECPRCETPYVICEAYVRRNYTTCPICSLTEYHQVQKHTQPSS